MREFTKSTASLMLALSLFGFKQLQNILTPRERGERRGPATKSLDRVTNATLDQFGETLRATFRTFDNLQRGLIGLSFNMFLPFLSSIGSTSGREARREERGTEAWSGSEPRRFADVVLSAPQSNLDDAVASTTEASMRVVGRRR